MAYKAIRAKGEKLKSITILDPDAPLTEEQARQVEESIPVGDIMLERPLHDTGSTWYSILSFLLPPVGIIGGLLFKKFKHLRNAKACFKGAWIGLGLLAGIVALFGIMLILATI